MALERKNSAFSLFTPKPHHFGWETNSRIPCPASFLASYPTEPVPAAADKAQFVKTWFIKKYGYT